MNKLLSAAFMRLKKEPSFWVGMAVMFAAGLFLPIKHYMDAAQQHLDTSIDTVFFGFILFIGVLSAVFCSLFLGTEYSDGTLRNKVVVGHSRSSIYLSSLITCAASGLLMDIAFLLPASAVGIPLLGNFEAKPKTVLLVLLGCALITITFSALLTMLAMVNQNKAVVAVISILFVAGLFFAAFAIDNMLKAPEFWSNISTGGPVESVPNPAYLRGAKRTFYQFLYDFLPTGQAMQYSSLSTQHLVRMPLYSLLITAASTFSGLWIFHKKNLK